MAVGAGFGSPLSLHKCYPSSLLPKSVILSPKTSVYINRGDILLCDKAPLLLIAPNNKIGCMDYGKKIVRVSRFPFNITKEKALGRCPQLSIIVSIQFSKGKPLTCQNKCLVMSLYFDCSALICDVSSYLTFYAHQPFLGMPRLFLQSNFYAAPINENEICT